jgi:subtilisin family serine protease
MRKSSVRTWVSVVALALAIFVPSGSNARSRDSQADFALPVKDVSPLAPRRVSDGRVLVKYRDAFAKRSEERAGVRALVAASVRRTYTILPDVEALALPRGASVDSTLAVLRADPRVEYAEADNIYSSLELPNDQYFGAEWGLHNTGQEVAGSPSAGPDVDINAPEAWQHATGAENIIVAVLDEGIDVTHPDLAANVWVNPGEVPGNGVDDDQNGFVDDMNGWDFLNDDATVFDGEDDPTNSGDAHGTHVGGTIGAVGNNGIGVTGVCWSVKLMSTKFLQHFGTDQDAIAGIDYVIRMKGRGFKIRAINASFGGGDYSISLQSAIASAGEAGILFVAASGNSGDDNDEHPQFPAGYDLPNVISVGALTRYNVAATFSNFGDTSVDLFAPGALIASTGPNGSYYYNSGTSMAAPHVTGAIALVASAAPSLDAVGLKQVVYETVHAVSDLRCATGGRLDVNAAVRLAIERTGGDGGDPGDPGDPEEPNYEPPVLATVRYLAAKKTVEVTGAQFRPGTSVIEIDGVAMPVIIYPAEAQQPDGTFTVLQGKAPGRIKFFLPRRESVQVTVYDSLTTLRSTPLTLRRR